MFMKRSRNSPSEPTAAQLKAAEVAMHASVCRSRPVLALRTEQEDTMDHQPHISEPVFVAAAVAVVEEQGLLDDLTSTSVEDFVSSFRVNGLECMSATYEVRHPIDRSPVSGVLTTALPEDVFQLIDSQLNLLDDYLKANCMTWANAGSDAIMECLLSVLRNLWYHQTQYRNTFFRDVESCIAAANDFFRMLEKMEDMMGRITNTFPLLAWQEEKQEDALTSAVSREAANLVSIFSNDAVYAVQRAVNFIQHTIHSSQIATDLFSKEWEDVMVHNEVAVSIIKTYEDYLLDIQNYIEHDFLYHKVVAALVRATVCFYTQSFVKKAEKLRQVKKRDFANQRAQRVTFLNSKRAITRMTYDIQVFRDYFKSVAKRSPTLMRLVTDELSIFVVLLECMWLAVGRTEDDSLEEFVVVVHKRVSGANSAITRLFLSDLWLLMGPKGEHHNVEHEIKNMDAELNLVSSRVKEGQVQCRTTITDSTCLRLDEVLRTLYQDRILQEKSSVCANLMREAKELRKLGQKVDPLDLSHDTDKRSKHWQPLQRFRDHISGGTKYDRELSSLFQKMG